MTINHVKNGKKQQKTDENVCDRVSKRLWGDKCHLFWAMP